MRTLGIVLVLVGVAVTGASFEAGRRTEAEYRSGVAALVEDDAWDVSVQRYDRGLFRSEAVTVLGPAKLPPGEESVARFVLRHRIDHGPYPVAWLLDDDFDGAPALAHVTTRPALEIEDAEVIEEIPLPLLVAAVFVRGEGAVFRLAPDAEADGLEDTELSADWAAIHGEARIAHDGSELSGRFVVPRLGFDAEDGGAFRLEGLRIEYDYAQAPGSRALHVGSARFRLGLLSVEGRDGAFTLRDLELENASDVSEGSWSLRADASFGALEGAGVRLAGGEVGLRVANLALEPLEELRALGPVVEAEGPASDAVKTELMGALGVLWPRLMAPGPELEITRLRLAMPEGEIRMAFRAGIDPSDPALLVHPLMSLPALEIDLELSLPQRVLEGWLARPRPVPDFDAEPAPWVLPAEAASQRVETWLERGHLDRHDDSYVTSVRVRQGMVRLNGRVVSFDAL